MHTPLWRPWLTGRFEPSLLASASRPFSFPRPAESPQISVHFPTYQVPGPRWPGHPFYSGHIVLWHMPPSLGSVLGLSPPTPICQAIVAPKDTMSHHHLAGAGVGGGCCYWHLVSGGNCAGSSGPTAEDGPAPEQSTGGFVERSGRPGLSQSAATPTPCFSFP